MKRHGVMKMLLLCWWLTLSLWASPGAGQVNLVGPGGSFSSQIISFMPMVFGSQSFNVTGDLVFIGDDQFLGLCPGGSLDNVTAKLLKGRIAVVLSPNTVNLTCPANIQAQALEQYGTLGVVFIQDFALQLSSTIWSSRAGVRNGTGIPCFFGFSYPLFDLLQFPPADIASIAVLLSNYSLRMVSTNSNWSYIANTFGVAFQVLICFFCVINMTLALWSLRTIVLEDMVLNKKLVISLASLCLILETLGNLVRFVYFVVDPLQMWGIYPLEVSLYLNNGLVSLTIMTTIVTSIFWTRVLRGKASRAPVSLKDIWIPTVLCILCLFLLEFLDGVILAAGGTIDDNLNIQDGFNTALGIVCFLAAIFLLATGTILLRKLRFGMEMRQEKESAFQKSIKQYVFCEMLCFLILTIWFLIVAWLDLLSVNNASYWAMWAIYFFTLSFASLSCIFVYFRNPKNLGTKVHSSSSDNTEERRANVAIPMTPMEDTAESSPSSPRSLRSIEHQFNTSSKTLDSM